MINLKDLEGSSSALIEILSWHWAGGHENPQSE
jgi:hypothetical protein